MVLAACRRGGVAVGKNNRVVVGLDIGTTKVSAVVAELTPEGSLEIIGVGRRPSKGLRKGIIVDVESTAEAVATAIEDAEVMAGIRIDAVYVGLGGGQVEGVTTEGSIELTAKEVTSKDIQHVIDITRSLTVSGKHQILHIEPIEFRLDGEVTGPHPIGMAGTKLGVWAQVMTAARPALDLLMKVADLAKVEVREVVAQQLASARAVLTEDEKEVGVVLIDIGGATTDVVVYNENTLRHIGSLAVGGNHVTHDLAIGLRTPVTEAERLKKQYGCALLSLVDTEAMVDVPMLGGKEIQPVPHKLLAEIVECRVEEIFSLALHQLRQSSNDDGLSAGVVLTGGASLMAGMVQAAEAIFERPVRLGLPLDIGGLTDLVHNPMYATGVGLALYGRDRLLVAESMHPGQGGFTQAFRRAVAWFQNFF
jgi:cell division protein FtsA